MRFGLLLAFVACSDRGLAFRNTGNPADSASAADSDVPPLPPDAPPGADPVATAAVMKDVAAKNGQEAREGAAFLGDGWELIHLTDGPDAQLVALDPALVTASPEALRVQLLSTISREGDTDNIVAIAKAASTPELRLAAIQALSRLNSNRAQNALLNLVTSAELLSDSDARHEAVAYLRPTDLDSPMAQSIAALLNDARLDNTDKAQLAFTLAFVGLRDGMTIALTGDAAARVAAARTLITQGGVQ